MGYLKDLGTGIIAKIDPQFGVPLDQYDLVLNPLNPSSGAPEKAEIGEEIYNLTSPYGHLHFAVGTGDDFVCFDYGAVVVPDDAPSGPGALWCLHATVNSETASFIDRFEYDRVFVALTEEGPDLKAIAQVLEIARDQVLNATDWCCEGNETMRKSMTFAGWNQKPCYYVNSVACCLFDSYAPFLLKAGIKSPKASEKMMRWGSKTMEKFVQSIIDLGR